MNIKVMDAGDAMQYVVRKPYKKSIYQEIYDAVKTLEKGKALVIDMEDAKTATKCASTLSGRVISDNKKGTGLFRGCYYSKSGSVIVIGKN